jgi:NTE family protein
MIRNLIISGGSAKTIAVIGAIKYLDEHSMLDKVATIIGTSAGSILALVMALGYTTSEMLHLLQHHFMGNRLQTLEMDELASLSMLTSFGMDSGQSIITFLEDAMFLKCFVKDMTFIEFTKLLGTNLVVCVANVSTGKTEYMSVDTSPDLSVITAVRMSIALPFILSPVKYKDCYYVDGGIYEHLPTGYIDQYKDALVDTLAITTISASSPVPLAIESFLDFSKALVSSIISKANAQKEISKKIKTLSITFDVDEDAPMFSFESLTFDISDVMVRHYVDKGYTIMKTYVETQMQ